MNLKHKPYDKQKFKHFVGGAVRDLDRWCGIKMTEDEFIAVVTSNAEYMDKVIDEINNHNYDEPKRHGLDTVAREIATEFVAMAFFGRPWPMYGDDESYRKDFFAELDLKKSTQNWKLECQDT